MHTQHLHNLHQWRHPDCSPSHHQKPIPQENMVSTLLVNFQSFVIARSGYFHFFHGCGNLAVSSIRQRSTKGSGTVSNAGSLSLFLFRSSNRKERTAASRGGGARPLNWRKISLQRQCYS